jgi:subtilisin family serine protease
MRRSALLAALVAALATVLPISAQAAGGQGADRYIVVLKQAVDSNAVANLHAARYGAQIGHIYSYALRGYSAVIPSNQLGALRADENVAFISVDGEVSATAQTLPTGVNRIEGDASSTASGDGSGSVDIGVAVIDTGIDRDHPDLNVAGGTNCSTGRKDRFDDGNGHGSHVAGTIGAKDDGIGVVGMAPSARLYAARVLNNAGSGSFSSVICGIDWVTQNAAALGIKVANMSLGGSGSDGSCSSDALHQAICNSVGAGVTYVVAAGNSNEEFSGFVPAAYNEVLTVTAMADFNGQPGGGAAATCRADVDETAADFSNFTTIGSSDVGHTIAGPGVCILSTWKGDGYNTISGTSMASPHVAGTAALCIATGNCTGDPATIMQKLRSDAAAQPPSYGFTGDPNSPSGTRYYGNLAYAGGY